MSEQDWNLSVAHWWSHSWAGSSWANCDVVTVLSHPTQCTYIVIYIFKYLGSWTFFCKDWRMVALGSSSLDLGYFFTDMNVKPSSRRKKNRFYKFSNSTNTWLHRGISGNEGFVVLSFLLMLEKQEKRGWVAPGCVHPPLVAQTGPSCLAPTWAPRDWLPWGTQQVPTAKLLELHKMLCFARICESLVWSLARCHPYLLLDLWLLVWSAMSFTFTALLSWKALSRVWAMLSASGGSKVVLQTAPAISNQLFWGCLSCIPKTPSIPTVLFLVS